MLLGGGVRSVVLLMGPSESGPSMCSRSVPANDRGQPSPLRGTLPGVTSPPDGAADQSLLDLAAKHRIATEYWDWQGRQVPVTAQALVAVLAGLGVDAGSPEAVHAAHEEADLREWRRVLPPTVVMREGWTPWVSVHVPHGTGVDVHVELEDGGRRHVRAVDNWVDPREVDGALIGRATVELPGDLPPGWHLLHAELDGGGRATATLIVSPPRLQLPARARATTACGA